MRRKQVAVFGLGEFGYSAAVTLAEQGCHVLAVDMSEERVDAIAPQVTQAVQANLADLSTLRQIGMEGLDSVLICLSQNLEASIMATMVAKECGVPHILAKVQNDVQETVLRKLGADEIIYPEKAMGIRVARSLIAGKFVDLIELTKNVSMAEMTIPAQWDGMSLVGLGLRKKGVNVIGRVEGERLVTQLDPERALCAGDTYVVVGETEALEHLI
ncbi:MAG: TrkA family potassium uptake protein [Lachnospiraceae bacterium]|nr:TrkA family potassium uptake protein [Lachnospiraceae bacterium]